MQTPQATTEVEMGFLALSIIPLLPLIGSMLTYIVGQRAKNIAPWVATLAALGSALFSTQAFMTLIEKSGGAAEGAGAILNEKLFSWIALSGTGGLSIDFAFRFDALSGVMCLVITWIGTLIHLYSIGYMAEDASKPRFFSYLNLFLFSMLLLVLGSNLLVLFVGWEGVGLCSYLLIGFWHKNYSYAKAGRKAFVVNRIGDAGVLLAMFLLLIHAGSLEFAAIQAAVAQGFVPLEIIALVALLLFVGATGKSAQIPLFVWLPDAMAGPTPVSALIHAATMVTAGVYLMARMHFLYDLAPNILALVCVISALTAFVAATTATVQKDIKKVLAYSTVSQLGFMFLAVSAGAYWVALFHVITHAFFKACLFLGAGSVIHGCHHEQDMMKMGGLRKLMPITFATYLVSTLAIAGIYPFAGYQSKHAIVDALKHLDNPHLAMLQGSIVLMVKFTAFLTAFYMTRSLMLTFFGEYRGEHKPHESPVSMWIPLVVLASLAAVGGYLLEGPMSLQVFLAPLLGIENVHVHATSLVEGIVGSWTGLLGVAIAVVFYSKLKEIPGKVAGAIPGVTSLFQGKWYFDEMYAFFIIKPLERISNFLWRGFDQGFIDGSVNGTGTLVNVGGWLGSLLQTGEMRHYALLIFASSITVLLFYFVW